MQGQMVHGVGSASTVPSQRVLRCRVHMFPVWVLLHTHVGRLTTLATGVTVSVKAASGPVASGHTGPL